MRIETEDGMITYTEWWQCRGAQLRVVEPARDEIVLQLKDESASMCIAQNDDLDLIQKLFTDINFGIFSGRRSFNVSAWRVA